MIQIEIPGKELYDDALSIFITQKKESLRLEHSLVSLSKWESKWCKPFLSNDEKTEEETIDYIRCMTISKNNNPDVYNYIPQDELDTIEKYISAPMTATWFGNVDKKTKPGKRDVITAEVIYYWMITFEIPMECEKWHLNRLFTLIQVCDVKNKSNARHNKKNKPDMTARAALNKARRKTNNTKG